MEASAKGVECPHCHHSNPSGTFRCASCDTWLGPVDATMTNVPLGLDWSRATKAQASFDNPAGSVQVGSVLGARYEILKLLGEGGMGAVYKARDLELDRLIALKVIRPELAGNPSILHRFKQELILARKITHRNVIRIYDLGVAERTRFITMEFIEGRDLASLLEERKYTPEEAVEILSQVCAALEAAHAEGVVHRDLKPQNIMIEDAGRVVVMDFGLARSMEATGMTQAGTVMGTPTYMSPEQVKGLPADERSDLFALGIIFYQMLTGEVPYKADTMLATMALRTQGPPPPPIQLDPAVPQPLNDMVLKSLATDPPDRYQRAALLGKDLHDWEEGTLHRAIVTPPMAIMAESKTGKWIALTVGAAVVAMAGIYGAYRLQNRPAVPVTPMTVIIADFNNHTGDPVFRGTLESTLKLALEGASFISAYDRSRMRDLGLPVISGTFDESKAQEIAATQGLNVVVSGSLDRRGADYQISLRAIQTVTGKILANTDETASGKQQVLFAVSKLGIAVRRALGDSTSESAQRLSMETLSAASLEAVHEYASGLDATSRGKNEEAIRYLMQAVDLDANFGMAYTSLASALANTGRRQEADKYIQEALRRIDHMTERERWRTRGNFYRLKGDDQKCVEEYGGLLEKYPSDTGAYNNLAFCLADLRMLKKAVDAERRAVAILPKRAIYHANVAAYSAFAGDFQTAAKEAAESVKLDYDLAFVTQAYASLGQEQIAQAAEAYSKLAKVNSSLGATALADLAGYEGRFQEAASLLEQGVADDTSGRKPAPDAAADKLSALAYVHFLRGQKGPALDAAKRALELNQAVRTRFLTARIYAAFGESSKAHELAAGLSADMQLEPQAYGRLIEGEIALKNGDSTGATQLFTKGNGLLDTWIGRFDLGRAYLVAGSFTQADSEFDLCLRRKGEALSLFLDPVPTYSYFPLLYYYQGQAREGMKSTGFAESYKKYLSIRGKAGEDPLLAEVRRRVAQ
jgi:eukaryotic-like serine/threonine-protein kinase